MARIIRELTNMTPPHIQPDYEIGYCDKCIQSTNHLNGVCQKCKQPEWMEGLREDFYKEQCEPKDDSDRLGIYENDGELVADWWLSKFSTTIQKEIERERESILADLKEQAEPYDGSKWHNQLSIETIEKIIKNKR